MRSFVRKHPDYKADSVISERVATDLMVACHRIGQGQLHVPELHGNFKIGTVSAKDAYAKAMVSHSPAASGGAKRTGSSEVQANLDKYQQRAELQSKRRKLQSDIEGLNSTLQAKERELSAINSQIADTLD